MRLSEYYGIQEAIKADVLQSEESYLKLLKVVGANQRYNFENQLSIYDLCPQATACADFDFWREHFGRTVMRGQKGIPILDVNAGYKRVRYVFDVSQTTSMNKEVNEVPIWKFREQDQQALKETIEVKGYDHSERQDFGVNLICVEDGIDSSKDAGKLMISVLSAVAEIERENIRVQTMEGRIQKAREGKWNGGFAPYGYKLVDGKLEINEEEAVAIRKIFDLYVNTPMGSTGIARHLESYGIKKIPRQNGKNPLFDAGLIRKILQNPVYNGKIAFGRRTLQKVIGTRNEYKQVNQDNYLLAEGIHEAIIDDETWLAAQVKIKSQAKKYDRVKYVEDVRTHLLTGIVKCPICGVGLYANKAVKYKKDGTKYKDFYYYACKHRHQLRGHSCTFNKQINEEVLDNAVIEVISKLVKNPKFTPLIKEKINSKVDTLEVDTEIKNLEKELKKAQATKFKLMDEIDSLDTENKHYKKIKSDLDYRLYRMYDKIEEIESNILDARTKKEVLQANKLTGDNIYKVLIYFDKLFKLMDERERRKLITSLVESIQVFEEKQPNGQWLKSIEFKLPIIEEDMEISLDKNKHVEGVALMLKVK